MKVDIFNTDKKYNIIYADPPWRYKDRKCNGACENHYSTMTIKELKELPIRDITNNDCVIFMWVTYPMLKEGIELMESWGFKYKTIGFQWIKQNRSGNGFFFGLGRWTRGNTECCLIGVKGKPKRANNRVSQLIISPIQRHSKKPHEAREKIVQLMGELPRIELFSREFSEGWDCWGNEV